jgi:hypothetical protein
LGGLDFSEIVTWGPKNYLIDGFCAEFFAKSIGENCNRLAFKVWEIFEKKLRGGSQNLDFFLVSCGSFSSTAASKNNIIVLK